MKVELRGAGREMFSYKGFESMLAGPAQTGKTYALCLLLHTVASNVHGSQIAMVRKTFASLSGSVVKTFQRIIKGSTVKSYGGETPSIFIYEKEGSKIYLGGMDNPDRVLSSERDLIYVNQAEELTEQDWEILATRCTGRGSVIEYPRLVGDCNPAGSMHWIRKRAAKGTLKLFNSVHKDNPELYDSQGKILPEGKKQLGNLANSLSGVRYKRLMLGQWATAEGAVYDNFDVNVHVCKRDMAEFVTFYLCQDDGYVNPAAILLVGEDSDKRWHCCKEFYQSGVSRESIVRTAQQWFKEYHCTIDIVDSAVPELIASLVAVGVNALAVKKPMGQIGDSCLNFRDRFELVKGDTSEQWPNGRPRYTVDPSCVNHINELESYEWEPDKPKDTPKKENDHTCDAIRYLHIHFMEPSGAFKSSEQFIPPTPGFERLEVDTERVTFDD